jgi:hypothetical protein
MYERYRRIMPDWFQPPYGPDFLAFWGNALAWWHGGALYGGQIYNPLHIVVMTLPLGLLPKPLAWLVWTMAAAVGFTVGFRRLGATWLETAAAIRSDVVSMSFPRDQPRPPTQSTLR